MGWNFIRGKEEFSHLLHLLLYLHNWKSCDDDIDILNGFSGNSDIMVINQIFSHLVEIQSLLEDHSMETWDG